jgi:hypothetical protein
VCEKCCSMQWGSGSPHLWPSGHSSWLQIQWSWFDSRSYQIFWEVVGLEKCPLSLVSTIEELFGRESRGSGLESREYGLRDVTLTTWHTLCAKVGTNFADKRRSLGRYSSLADSGHGVSFSFHKHNVPRQLHRLSQRLLIDRSDAMKRDANRNRNSFTFFVKVSAKNYRETKPGRRAVGSGFIKGSILSNTWVVRHLAFRVQRDTEQYRNNPSHAQCA